MTTTTPLHTRLAEAATHYPEDSTLRKLLGEAADALTPLLMPEAERPGLAAELRNAINRYSAENASNTPDFILADYMIGCLDAYNTAVSRRGQWYGRMDRPGQASAEAEGGGPSVARRLHEAEAERAATFGGEGWTDYLTIRFKAGAAEGKLGDGRFMSVVPPPESWAAALRSAKNLLVEADNLGDLPVLSEATPRAGSQIGERHDPSDPNHDPARVPPGPSGELRLLDAQTHSGVILRGRNLPHMGGDMTRDNPIDWNGATISFVGSWRLKYTQPGDASPRELVEAIRGMTHGSTLELSFKENSRFVTIKEFKVKWSGDQDCDWSLDLQVVETTAKAPTR